MNRALKKLQSKRGSGIAEALIGFLISVLSVLTLFGIVSTTTKLIQDGDVALEKLYVEEKTLDLYNVKGTTGVLTTEESDLYANNGELKTTYSSDGTTKDYIITVKGDPEHAPGTSGFSMDNTNGQKTRESSYFVTSKYHMFAFSAD